MKTCVLKFSYSHHLSYVKVWVHLSLLRAYRAQITSQTSSKHKFFNGNALGDPVSDFHVSTPLKDIEWSRELTTWESKM